MELVYYYHTTIYNNNVLNIEMLNVNYIKKVYSNYKKKRHYWLLAHVEELSRALNTPLRSPPPHLILLSEVLLLT